MTVLNPDIQKGRFETIDPPRTLQAKVRKLTGREAKFDPIARAEQAMKTLSVNFADWMDDEVTRLMTSWRESREKHFSDEARGVLFRAAHDMRGQASTLGFPTVGRIAGVLCDILDALGDNPIPDAFVEQYVQAIRAIARETRSGEDNSVAAKLADELSAVGNELIARYERQAAEETACEILSDAKGRKSV